MSSGIVHSCYNTWLCDSSGLIGSLGLAIARPVAADS